MKYLISASEGPGFASPKEMLQVLQDIVLPSFEALIRMEAEGKILAGGVPLGDRALVFILEAASHEAVDRMLRSLPMWGALKWKVVPLQTFGGRAAQDREFVQRLLKAMP